MSDFRDLFQLTICDICRAAVADRCYVPLKIHVCLECAEMLARRSSNGRGYASRDRGEGG